MTRHISEVEMQTASMNGRQYLPTTGYLRIKQILGPDGPLPISRSGFWAAVKDGRFPQPRKISPRVTVWRAEDIHELLSRIENGNM